MPTKEELESADLMMENVIQLGKFSFELEEKREESLISQSGHMLTAFSVFSAVLFTATPIIIDNVNISANRVLVSVAIVSAFLIASLILAVFAQWRYKYMTIVSVDALFDEVKADALHYQTKAQFGMQWKTQLSQLHRSKKKNNDRRAAFVILSMLLFLCSIAALFLASFILILCR